LIIGSSLCTVEGTATLTPMSDHLLHYKEEGTLLTAMGKKNKIQKEYLYIYNAKKDEIGKRFFRKGKDLGLFYWLNFQQTHYLEKPPTIVAYGKHICANDHYKAVYVFRKSDRNFDIKEFRLDYEVTGVNKHYESTTVFTSTEKT
jgi:hypothetical protein